MAGGRGDAAVEARGDGHRPELGFTEGSGLPSVLLTENFIGIWKCDECRVTGYRDKIYKVWNPHTGKVAWRGKDSTFAGILTQRINGWITGQDFPPPVRVSAPAYAAPVNQPEVT